MSAQLARPGPYDGHDQEPDAYYIAYSAPYDVDEQAGTVDHQVQVSVIPGWLGTTQIRRCSSLPGANVTTSPPPLSYDVFTAPSKPFTAPPPRIGDPQAWDPVTSTLIFGARDAVLMDALTTVREATALADWVALHERRLTTIYITHGHTDHYLGLSVLLDRFPDARAVATAATVEQMRTQTSPQVLSHGDGARYPGQIAEKVALAEPLNGGQFELEGLPLVVIETGHTDTVDTTSLHVPDLRLIVSGDVAYNHCHMYVGPTTAVGRAEWIAALNKLAALNPAAVVAGHKDPTQGNPPSILAESRGYLEYYGQLREAALPDQKLFDAMVTRYPDWVSRQQFLILGFTGSADDPPGHSVIPSAHR
jgi:glyoxylase-like metal-dependent hydrolase (beta-lactamase superfamily II)